MRVVRTGLVGDFTMRGFSCISVRAVLFDHLPSPPFLLLARVSHIPCHFDALELWVTVLMDGL